MNDDALKLLEKIQKQFNEEIKNNAIIKNILDKQNKGTADYADSLSFAKEIGKCVGNAFKSNISDDVLPDGKMYYDIAKTLIEPICQENYKTIASHCAAVQTSLNKKANIGLNAIQPKYNQDRTDGLIKYISSAERYSDRESSFIQSLSTNAKLVVDDAVKANVDFHYNSGLNPKIIRKSTGKCCKWCQEVAGIYNYYDVKDTGNDVFRRHANCDCTVTYDPGDGSKKVQDAWSKKWNENSKLDVVKKRLENIQDKAKLNLPEGVEDVTKIYLSKATPGKGKIEIDLGVDVKNNEEDINIAKWIKDTLGGEIRVVKASNKYKEGTPDYIWNNKKWELKSPSSKNAIDKRMQKAGHQLGEKDGGMVIDITNVKNLTIQEITGFIAEKLPKRAKGNTDLIIVKGAKLVKVIRYKKK